MNTNPYPGQGGSYAVDEAGIHLIERTQELAKPPIMPTAAPVIAPEVAPAPAEPQPGPIPQPAAPEPIAAADPTAMKE